MACHPPEVGSPGFEHTTALTPAGRVLKIAFTNSALLICGGGSRWAAVSPGFLGGTAPPDCGLLGFAISTDCGRTGTALGASSWAGVGKVEMRRPEVSNSPDESSFLRVSIFQNRWGDGARSSPSGSFTGPVIAKPINRRIRPQSHPVQYAKTLPLQQRLVSHLGF